MPHVDFLTRGSFSPRAKVELGRLVQETVARFFKHCPEPVEHVRLTAFRAGNGGDPRNLIKVVHRHPDFGHSPKGIPVVVYTEGTQGITSLLEVVGKDDMQVAQLLAQGPYQHKAKTCQAAKAAASESRPAQEATKANSELVSEQPPPDAVPQTPPQNPEPSPPQAETTVPGADVSSAKTALPPHQKLVQLGFREEEIDRLRTTLSSIVYREIGEGEIPNTLQVPVRKITQAIMEEMQLSPNEANNYRGVIGSFYSSKISMFALKLEKLDDSSDPEATYTDWIFDCDLVLDFVGGRDQMVSLTRKREQEIAERIVEEQKPKVPPPTAQQVTEVILEGFVADAEILEVAAKMLKGKQEAVVRLEQARQNEQGFEAEVSRLEAQLKAAQAGLSEATALREVAKAEVSKFTLSEEIRKRVMEAKARFDALMKNIGL